MPEQQPCGRRPLARGAGLTRPRPRPAARRPSGPRLQEPGARRSRPAAHKDWWRPLSGASFLLRSSCYKLGKTKSCV
ncbi:hypothetical protein VULLAG_LOCUS358 [Vulpes lagopus]